MLRKLDQFLNQWLDGLLRPFSFAVQNRQIAKLEDSSTIVWPKKKSKRVYLSVPNHLMLNTPISPALRGDSISNLVEQLLPFQNDEVFATSDANTLFAVLKSDIEIPLSQTNEFGKSLSGIVFSHNKALHFVDTIATAQTRPTSLKLGSAFLAGLLLVLACLYWMHKKNEQHINSLKQTIAQLETSRAEFESLNLNLAGATLDSVLSGLSKTNELLNLNSKVDQISLRSVSNNLELILDATSVSAIDQLTRISDDENFEEVDFVSAISQNTLDSNERYRLIATFNSVAAEVQNSTKQRLGAQQDDK